MTNYGVIFRKLRQNRHYSLKQIAGDELSIAQLSRFERGDSDLSFSKFIYALNKLHLTMDDFMAAVEGYKNNDRVSLMSDIITLDYERNVAGFKALKRIEDAKYQTNPKDETAKLNSILLQGFICQYDDTSQMAEDDLAFVSDYLFCTEEWGMYEIILVGNLYVYYEMPQISRMVSEILKHRNFYQEIGRHRSLVVLTLLNVYMTSIERQAFLEADYFRSELKKLLDNETQAYHRMIFLYLNGFYTYKRGDKTGKNQMEQVIAMFEAIESHNLAQNYKEHYKRWVT